MEAELSTWDIPELNVEWLQSNIGSQLGGKVIAKCVYHPLVSQTMSLGTLQRLKLYFTDETEYSMVIKKESSNYEANIFAAPLYKSEVDFYQLMAKFCKAKLPRCFYSSLANDSSATTLILESIDTSESGNTQTGLTLYQCHSALKELGKFHGSYVNNGAVLQHAKSAAEHMASATPEQWLPLFMRTWKDFILSYFSSPETSNKVIEVFEHCAIHVDNWTIMLGLMGAPTLIHGDYKGTNLLFSDLHTAGTSLSSPDGINVDTDAGNESDTTTGRDIQTTILDFQTVYTGGDIARADDVMYLIVGSMDSRLRSVHQDELLTTYLQAFTATMASPTVSTSAQCVCCPTSTTSGSARNGVDGSKRDTTHTATSTIASGSKKNKHTSTVPVYCQCCGCNNSDDNDSAGMDGPIPVENYAVEAAQSLPEFKMYCRMAVQGQVYRCLMFTFFMANESSDTRVQQLGALIKRTVEAIVEVDLHTLLAVGRR